MTTLRTPGEVVFDSFEKEIYEREDIITQDRLAISTALVEALEEKIELLLVNNTNRDNLDFAHGYRNALLDIESEAQNIIRTLLESK